MTYVKNLPEFIHELSKLRKRTAGGELLFRGHRSKKYKAEPSVFRSRAWRKNEHTMLRQVLAQHPTEFAQDTSTFELLARAQHYGLPTRLLDITSNPLVALYFACAPSEKQNESRPPPEPNGNPRAPRPTGEVVVFFPDNLRKRFFDSEVVAALCNLTYLDGDAKQEIRKHLLTCYEKAKTNTTTPQALDDMFTKQFNNHPSVRELVRLVRKDNSSVGDSIRPRDLADIVMVLPRRLDKRIAAQSGAFLVYGLFNPESDETKFNFLFESFDTEELYISPKHKGGIMAELNSIGVNKETLFPSLERTADKIKAGQRV
ncbi:FRG domain-containing protein [Oricola indica]|uniref:FRG domain-containing protein n=1 Tax=Oricola indica TaxID=2872591 RepID=UPI001CBFC4A9|nr:FRG domain-containing protein [Oricola indica]